MPAPRQINTSAIVLRRVNYGEADRILTLITPDQGKISAIAKGARRVKSKLAGGIELFSVSEISFIKGKNDIDTLTSSRLQKYFSNIVSEMARSTAGYDFIKIISKITEDNPEAGYFNLLAEAFAGLDDKQISEDLTRLWFELRLLKISGHSPEFFVDGEGEKLSADKTYDFDVEQMRFVSPAGRKGAFNSGQIKFLRLAASAERPHLLQRVEGIEKLLKNVKPTVSVMLQSQIPT